MRCEEARLLIADVRSDNDELESHLSACEGCRQEADVIRSAWSKLGRLPVPEPRPVVAARFYAALDAYYQGLQEERSGLWRWWPAQPVWQFAACIGCLAVGLLAGSTLLSHRGGASSQEITELHKEMTGMRQLVTLSLLQQQSAVERLRGVTWSYRAEPNDMEVLSALLQTVNSDPNVDVRLAAVDALKNFGNSPVARKGLANALLKQDSPLVEISIVDALAELQVKSSIPAMQSLWKSPGVDSNVQKRITEALKTFE